MKKSKKEEHFIRKPVYKGGKEALNKFIRENLIYPEEALREKIEGRVFVRYDISHRGKVIRAKVIQSLGYGCDEEAIRLIKLLKFEVPKNRGVKVTFHKDLYINFKLPKKKTPPKQSYQYQVKSSAPAKKEPPKKSSGGYSYTIKIK